MNCDFRLAICLMLMASSGFVWGKDNVGPEALALLVTAKFSGGCGIITQMAAFQQSTKMSGGAEFLERFVNTESARLGMTTPQYLEQCRKSSQIYQSYYDELEGSNSQ